MAFASIASALVNLLVQQQSHNRRLTRSLATISLLLVAAGLVALVAREGVARQEASGCAVND
jgi:hypothetical protein